MTGGQEEPLSIGNSIQISSAVPLRNITFFEATYWSLQYVWVFSSFINIISSINARCEAIQDFSFIVKFAIKHLILEN